MRLLRGGNLGKPIKAPMFSEHKHIIDQSTLSSPPLSPSSRIHFLQGIKLFGRALYGEDWADAELCARESQKEPDAEWIMSWGAVAEPLIPDSPEPGETAEAFEVRLAGATANHSEWLANDEKRKAKGAETLRVNQERWQKNWNAVSRVDAAYNKLLQAIIDDEILAFWRTETQGSGLMPVRGDFFAAKGLHWTLRRSGTVRHYDKTHHVFLDRDQLNSYSSGLGCAKVEDDPTYMKLSPDMRLAMTVIREWNIQPDSCPSIPSIASQLVEIAEREGRTLSPRRAKEIARLVRGAS
jgi:hypothetical protein